MAGFYPVQWPINKKLQEVKKRRIKNLPDRFFGPMEIFPNYFDSITLLEIFVCWSLISNQFHFYSATFVPANIIPPNNQLFLSSSTELYRLILLNSFINTIIPPIDIICANYIFLPTENVYRRQLLPSIIYTWSYAVGKTQPILAEKLSQHILRCAMMRRVETFSYQPLHTHTTENHFPLDLEQTIPGCYFWI